MAGFSIGTGTGGVGTAIVNVRCGGSVGGETPGVLQESVLKNNNSPLYPQLVTLTGTTFSAVAIPTKAGGVIIQPPAGNTATLTIKGITGDTGIAINKLAPTMLVFDTTPPATLGMVASATITDIKLTWF